MTGGSYKKPSSGACGRCRHGSHAGSSAPRHQLECVISPGHCLWTGIWDGTEPRSFLHLWSVIVKFLSSTANSTTRPYKGIWLIGCFNNYGSTGSPSLAERQNVKDTARSLHYLLSLKVLAKVIFRRLTIETQPKIMPYLYSIFRVKVITHNREGPEKFK